MLHIECERPAFVAGVVVVCTSAKGCGENAVARDLRRAFRAQLPVGRSHAATGDTEDVSPRRRRGSLISCSNRSLTVSSGCDGVSTKRSLSKRIPNEDDSLVWTVDPLWPYDRFMQQTRTGREVIACEFCAVCEQEKAGKDQQGSVRSADRQRRQASSVRLHRGSGP